MLKGKRSVAPSKGSINFKKSSVEAPPTHWNEIVQETVLSASDPDNLYFTLAGGADQGQFPHLGEILSHPEEFGVSVRGFGLSVGDVLLDIQGQKVSGFTGQDVQEVLRQSLSNGKMVVVRALPKGKTRIFHF